MLFNTSYKNDFKPELTIDGVLLEVVDKMKLLGVIITSDLKWKENTDFITKKAYSRLWLIKRLKQMGASTRALLDTYLYKTCQKRCRICSSSMELISHTGVHKSNRKGTKKCICCNVRFKIPEL